MSKLGYLLTLPVMGAPRLVRSLAGLVDDEVQRTLLDEDALRGELLDLQEQFDGGVLTEEEYAVREARVLERLEAARIRKLEQST